MLKLPEIKELAPDEIDIQLKKSRLELVSLRMKFASRQLEDPSQISKKRKEIARLLTVQTEKLNNGSAVTSEEKETKVAPAKKTVKAKATTAKKKSTKEKKSNA